MGIVSSIRDVKFVEFSVLLVGSRYLELVCSRNSAFSLPEIQQKFCLQQKLCNVITRNSAILLPVQ